MIFEKQLLNFVKNIKVNYDIVGPVYDVEHGGFLVKEIEKPEEVDWSGKTPIYSFKKYFLPATEKIISYKNGSKLDVFSDDRPVAIFGMNVLDLRALGMTDLVFKRDSYYQKRRLRNLIVGIGAVDSNMSDYKTFSEKFEKNILEHLNFDIFLEKEGNKYRVFAGSRLGQKTLTKHDINDYEHIQFTGFIREDGKDKRMLRLYENIKKSADSPVWEELGKRCYACGKCSSVCPTCYCFDFYDIINLEDSKKIRQWGSCFYPEFSQVAGDHKFLDTIAKRIFYWYYHKFVVIPEKHSVPGCVSCLRCVKACPAGIDIRKVLNSL